MTIPTNWWPAPTTRSSVWLAAQIRAGEVYINTLPMLDPAAPWGGFKASGWGREMTAEAIDSCTETKGVWVNLGG
jgi:aldehyde dehydrogenase (NAD+)